MSNMTNRWVYSGDVSLEYGGAYIDLSTYEDGYCSAVRVTDLDSGCGFTGACLIEHVVINGTTDPQRIKAALQCCGGNVSPGMSKEGRRHYVADCLLNYGCCDPDDNWDGYQSPHTEVVQMESDGPMVFDGWMTDKRLANTDLKDYVESVHLN